MPRTAMPLANTRQRYGAVAILLHWIMAALLGGLIVMGLYMVRLPDAGFDTRKITLILYHKELGLAAFAVAAVRFAWRLGSALPALADTLPDWQKVVARFVHLSFYGFMLALPVTGWLMSSAAAIPVSVFGIFDLPDLVSQNESLFRLLIRVHRWLAYGLLACILAHSGAALTHHFVYRDDTLSKMLASARRR